MPNRGKFVIVLILLAGILAASTAWWHQRRQGRRVLQLWGAESAYRIRIAPRSELLQLLTEQANFSSDLESLRVGSQTFRIGAIIEISNQSGFVHARQALIQDASYDWTKLPTPTDLRRRWTWALRFSDKRGSTLLALDLDQGIICDVERGIVANIQPIRDGLRLYFSERAQATQP